MSIGRKFGASVCWMVLAAGFGAPARAEPVETAGWATVEITPPLGISLGGRGGPDTRATKVLDPLYGQVLVTKDKQDTRLVVVSFDVVGLPHELSDEIRTDLVHALGVDWNLVVLNASHTHSGPYMIRSLMAGVGPHPQVELDYFKMLRAKILGAARAAEKSMKPVTIETREGRSDVGINRRGKNKAGKRAMIPDPAGAFDEKIWLLKFSPVNGDAPALIFSYACHPVIAYGYAYSAISADFPGVTRNALREALGTNVHCQFVQGFAGNVRPRVVADLEKNQFRPSKPQDLQQAGHDLAQAILTALKQPGERLDLHLAGTADRPFLPRDKPPPRKFYEDMRASAKEKTNNFHLAVSDYWLQRYDSGEGFARGDSWSLGLIRMADNLWIVHSGGEPCAEWRGKMSQWLAPLRIVTWGYCQEAKSYLPTESLLPEGGYEVLESNQAHASTPAPFAPGIEEAIRKSLLRQLAFIKAEK